VAGSRSRGSGLSQRVESAAEAALRDAKSVSPLDVFGGIGWLPGNLVDRWRQGRVDSLEEVMNVGPDKLLVAGVPRDVARDRVRASIDGILNAWLTPR